MTKKIVLIGATGMLGTELKQRLENEHTVISPSREQCNIADWMSVEKFFSRVDHADMVINCAAFTNVDQCEEDASTAFTLNSSGPHILAKCAKKIQSPFLHVSTDYVFDGQKKEYTVTDIPSNPGTIYGRSKLLGETNIQASLTRFFIVRTAWLYGPHGANFVETMLKLSRSSDPLKVVFDQIGCPTYTKDLINVIVKLIDSDQYGIYHAAGQGSCSWYEFAKAIVKDKQVIPISTKKSFDLFPRIKAQRPPFSVLKNNVFMRDWKDALTDYLSRNV